MPARSNCYMVTMAQARRPPLSTARTPVGTGKLALGRKPGLVFCPFAAPPLLAGVTGPAQGHRFR